MGPSTTPLRSAVRGLVEVQAADRTWLAPILDATPDRGLLRVRLLVGAGAPEPGASVRVSWIDGAGWSCGARVSDAPAIVDPDGQVEVVLGVAAADLPALGDTLRVSKQTLLAVDDEPANLELLSALLEDAFDVVVATSAERALEILRQDPDIAILVTDQRMPVMSGVELVARMRREGIGPEVVTIVLTAYPEADKLERFVNEGAIFRFLRKPADVAEIEDACFAASHAHAAATLRARDRERLARTCDRLSHEIRALRSPDDVLGMVGASDALRTVGAELGQFATTDVTVHISGETGTGKERAARIIHTRSRRQGAPFVAVNCAVIPETLIQSTLFGHRRGAFTGADRDAPGLFVQAQRGTIFLDEVAELSPAGQASLLRVLQEREVIAVGATRATPVDVRVVSATHKDLRAEVGRGCFRDDLYYRLMVAQIHMPPLRARAGDVPLLAQHFAVHYGERFGKRVAGISSPALQALDAYAWPGNIRELENEIQRAVALLLDGQPILAAHLSPRLVERPTAATETGPAAGADDLTYDEAVVDFQRRLIGRALASADGVVAHAAERLGMDRTRLSKLARRIGLL